MIDLAKEYPTLNKEQLDAVATVDGAMLILAGAGSGKTTVLINRIEHMINHCGIRPWNILAITFTNKAAGELKDRISAKIGEMGQDVLAATFHSLCARMLRVEIERLGFSRDFTIYDTDDSVRVIKDCLASIGMSDKMFPPKQVLGSISRAKDKLITPDMFIAQAGGDYRLDVIGKVYKAYQERLKSSNALDFDDIIVHTVNLLESCPDMLEKYQNRFKYILVDEYQDTNHVQYKLISLLSKAYKNICVVGDDDQSIYKFRGADIANILNFEEEFPGAKVIRLEQNYRSTSNILNGANGVIANNKGRKGKNLWTDKGDGEKIIVRRLADDFDEARYVGDTISQYVSDGGKFSNNAVLYRMNAQSNNIERYFVRAGIPYKIVGGLKFYERKEIKDILAYLSLINNTADVVRLGRIINEPKRGIGDTTVKAVKEIAATLGVSAFEVLRTSDEYAKISARSPKLMQFADMIEGMKAQLPNIPLENIVDVVLDDTGYRQFLTLQGPEGQTRLENINELKSNIVSYINDADEPSLSGFLEEVSLYTDLDSLDAEEDRVTMMTLHSAKGLEFDNVFIVGVEETIFPGIKSLGEPSEMEEERRLAYVGITRAKKILNITCAAQRLLFGQTKRNKPSMFINEIPKELVDFDDATVKSYVAMEKMAEKLGTKAEIGIGSIKPKEQLQCDFAVGDSVKHMTLGVGMVLSITPMGGDTLVEVAFEKAGTKKLMMNFARLKKA